jgi:hypothetical protein
MVGWSPRPPASGGGSGARRLPGPVDWPPPAGAATLSGVAAPSTTTFEQRALELATGGDTEAAVLALVQLADGHKDTVEAARNRLVRHIHGNAGDWRASLAVGLCNKAIVEMGWTDPYDWRGRLGNALRKP